MAKLNIEEIKYVLYNKTININPTTKITLQFRENIMKISEQEKVTIQNKLREITLPIEFKNYRELCKFFAFSPTGGDTKKKRLEYIDHLTNMEILKQKIALLSLKSNVGNNDIFENGKDIIIEEFKRLNERQEYIIVAGYRRLAKLFGFVNDNFFNKVSQGFTDKFNEEVLKLEHYDKELGQKFYNSIENKYRYCIHKTLKEMQDNGIISVEHGWYKTLLEFKKENENEFEDLEFVFQNNKTFIKCSDLESMTLDRIKLNLLKELGCNDINEVYRKKQDKKYYKELRARILQAINATALELMEIVCINDTINMEAEPFKKERLIALQKENNKIFSESFFKRQDKNIDKSRAGVNLGYFTALLEQGEQILQVYHCEKGVYMKNDEICWYDDSYEEIPTEKAIKPHKKIVSSQKQQLKKTLDIVCTYKKS